MVQRKSQTVKLLVFGIGIFVIWSGLILHGCELIAAQGQTSGRYSNSAEGLKQFLLDGVSAAKIGDKNRIDAFTRGMRIPDPQGWYVATYGKEEGASRAENYKNIVEGDLKLVRESTETVAREGGEGNDKAETKLKNPAQLADDGIDAPKRALIVAAKPDSFVILENGQSIGVER